ncbi:hypothetical protein FIM02_01965 [SAR202 cluster bacterium AD-802-E10_MRT_200m]|nr:hypothetical protein [SAR202 cluster bacterium AD-802-E10_MRT_200m]
MATINRQYRQLFQLLNVSGNNFQTGLCILIILLCGTLSFSWFEHGKYLAPNDLAYPFSSSSVWYAHAFTWDERFSRESVPGIMRLMPYLSFVAAAEKIGLSPLFVERLLFYFLFTFPGLAAFGLAHTLIRDKSAFPGLLAALFYMMNPLTLLLKWNSTTPSLFAYGMMPLLLALYIVGLRKQSLLKYPLLFGAASLLGASATTISYFVSASVPIIGYFLFSCILSYRQFSQILIVVRTTFVMSLSYLLFNLWWILPFLLILSHRAGLVTTGDSATFNLDVFNLESTEASLMDLIRGQGYWAFHKESGGVPYYPFASSYLLTPMVILSFLVPGFGILALMRKVNDAKMVFLGFLFIVGIVLTSGVHPPFGDLNAWFFEHIPGYAMFRIIPDKFGPLIMLPLAVLYGVGAYEFLSLVHRALPVRVPRVMKSVIVLIPAISIPIMISGFYMFPCRAVA